MIRYKINFTNLVYCVSPFSMKLILLQVYLTQLLSCYFNAFFINRLIDFMVNVLWHFLSIKGKIIFLQLGRFSAFSEQTYRDHFQKRFDFFLFNKTRINQVASSERIVVFDPSYIPKAVKRRSPH